MPDPIVQLLQMPLAAAGKIDKQRLRAEFGRG
jgi:non-ribosomal peptide synthetase component E (peptide arylation enzyme)